MTDVPCPGERCERCALARRYHAQPRISSSPPRGWEPVIAELRRLGLPVVAFGQTIFWDEPAKAVLRLMLDRLAPEVVTVVGIHDSDYFSKLHGHGRAGLGFALCGLNDWTHRGLWAAVGETTSLFGAETPPHVAELHAAGVPLKYLARLSGKDVGDFIDEATAAYGWRGVAQLGARERIARDMPVSEAGEPLVELFQWGLSETIALLDDPAAREAARGRADALLARLQTAIAEMPGATVSQLYQRLITDHYADLLGTRPELMRTTTTVEYLRFNRETAGRARFQPVQVFLCDRVGQCARETYNEVIAGEGMYALDQFGEGAIPFDLVVPGRGRGTLRVFDREVRAELADDPLVVHTPERVVLLEDLAAVLEDAVGPEVAIVGKALLGPVMFCSEAVLVLHEGASAYVPRTQAWLDRLNASCGSLRAMPILRLGHRAYDALPACKAVFRLPAHLAEAFGTPTATAQEIGRRWRTVLREQQAILARLSQATSSSALLELVAEIVGDDWVAAARELERARQNLRAIGAQIEQLRARLATLRAAERQARHDRAALEQRSGALRRLEQETGDRQPREQARAEIARVTAAIHAFGRERGELRAQIADLSRGSPATEARTAAAQLGLRAEHARLALARRALLTRNLELGNRRPTAWWFTVLDPSGHWFAEAARRAEVWLEDLSPNDGQRGTGNGQ